MMRFGGLVIRSSQPRLLISYHLGRRTENYDDSDVLSSFWKRITESWGTRLKFQFLDLSSNEMVSQSRTIQTFGSMFRALVPLDKWTGSWDELFVLGPDAQSRLLMRKWLLPKEERKGGSATEEYAD
ncbi:hypothetical protein Tco_0635645 [Tanacetum coccineum]